MIGRFDVEFHHAQSIPPGLTKEHIILPLRRLMMVLRIHLVRQLDMNWFTTTRVMHPRQLLDGLSLLDWSNAHA